MSNISENLFDAIQILIDKKINEVSFDTTIICEVVEMDIANKTEYIVKNDTMTFKAYSLDKASYIRGAKVYVMIPQGNYNLKKIILGEVQTEVISAKQLLRPIDSLIPIGCSNWLSKENVNTLSRWEAVEVPIKNINTNLNGSKQFGIKISFSSWIEKAIKGNYGLAFYINEDTSPYSVIDSSEFYGNPYAYDDGFFVEKVFTLPDNISKLKIIPYKSKFYTENNVEIEDFALEIKDASLLIGMDKISNQETILDLYLNDNQNAKYTMDSPTVNYNLNALFIENEESYFDGKSLPSNYEIRWFYYQAGAENADDLAGPGWVRVDQKTMTYTFEIDTTRNDHSVKALIVNGTNLVAEKIFKFTNDTRQDPNQDIDQTGNQLVITINGNKNHSGIFNVYTNNKYALDYTTRNLTIGVIQANGEEINENDKIQWEFSETALLNVPNEKNWNSENNITEFQASINSTYSPGQNNTVIRCTVIKANGKVLTGEKVFVFGEKSVQGTSYGLNLICYLNEDKNQIVRNILVPNGDFQSLTIKVTLTDEFQTEREINSDNLVWSWKFDNQETKEENSITTSDIKLTGANTSTPKIELINNNINHNFNILVATLKGFTLENGLVVDLTANLPIIIANNNTLSIDGPTEFYFNSMGNISYTKSRYRLLGNENEEKYIWTLHYYEGQRLVSEKIKNGLITNLSDIVEKFNTETQAYVEAKASDETVVWRQPLLFIDQVYESQILNDWNGKQKIDGDKNFILSALLGAGKKDKDNTFTGVLMGELGTIDDKGSFSKASTGLYGFNKGKKTFSLDAQTGEGFIGGWTILPDRLSNSTNKIECYLAPININTDEPVIKIADIFKVDGNGKLYARSGEIAGWTMGTFEDQYTYNNSLYSDAEEYRVFLRSNSSPGEVAFGVKKYKDASNKKAYEYTFYVYNDGEMKATYGNIAGWNFDNYRMYNANNMWSTGLSTTSSDGDPAFWAGYVGKGSTPWESQGSWTTETKFYVTNTGFLKATNAEIEGKITANQGGKIGGWIIDAGQNYIKSNNGLVWLNGDGKGTATAISPVGRIAGSKLNNIVLRVGAGPADANFAITEDGKIFATEGAIGDWRIVKIPNSNEIALIGQMEQSDDGAGYNIVLSPRQIQFDWSDGVDGDTYILPWKTLMEKVGIRMTYDPAIPM